MIAPSKAKRSCLDVFPSQQAPTQDTRPAQPISRH
jgi:hypothetical protein